MKKEFWKINMSDREYSGLRTQFYVFASSAAAAEKKGIALLKSEEYKRPYCISAEHVGYIEN